MILKIQNKPVIREAMLWTGENYQEILAWAENSVIFYHSHPDKMFIRTLEGRMVANKGDFIVKGVRGEFYPCKPDIFGETYDIITGEENGV